MVTFAPEKEEKPAIRLDSREVMQLLNDQGIIPGREEDKVRAFAQAEIAARLHVLERPNDQHLPNAITRRQYETGEALGAQRSYWAEEVNNAIDMALENKVVPVEVIANSRARVVE